jgi:hypothetical protein
VGVLDIELVLVTVLDAVTLVSLALVSVSV